MGVKKNITWEQVYELPLTKDEFGSYVWSKNDVMALQFVNVPNKMDRVEIVKAINGFSFLKLEGLTNDGCDFYTKDNGLLFFVRGWGYLTGTGSLNLPEKKALEIQNGFISHVLKSLSV